MRMSILSAALLAITLGVSHAPAGEISRSQLAAIGLPGFKAMSYEQALAVRGKSITAIATGHSIAVGGTPSFYVLVNHSNPVSMSGTTLSIGVSAVAGGSSTLSVH